ncbi:hypothetical protein SOP93_21570 [Peribacillus frigoritolerans]|uniref:hypothetical protein n=1 Tax=Peribacillus frigoritolerans TaxID=450367 RepID=UPI002B2428B7|nr:hypothetical protein [Peribacillus frigoritolerans]MEB2493727.1 hypothetical protein [Peribacillus frigoritolerans]
MIKNLKYMYIMVLALLIIVSLFGYLTRQSFQDNTIPYKLPSNLENATISIFDEESYINKYFKNNLSTYNELKEQSDFIIIGEIIDDRTKFNSTLKTKVKVKEVLKSKQKLENIKSIIVYEPSEFLYDTYYVNSGYNIMKTNQDYILFLRHLEVPNGYTYKNDESISFIPTSTYFGKYSLNNKNLISPINLEELNTLKYKDLDNYEIITDNKEKIKIFNTIKEKAWNDFGNN